MGRMSGRSGSFSWRSDGAACRALEDLDRHHADGGSEAFLEQLVAALPETTTLRQAVTPPSMLGRVSAVNQCPLARMLP